jgi:hypothetical protein
VFGVVFFSVVRRGFLGFERGVEVELQGYVRLRYSPTLVISCSVTGKEACTVPRIILVKNPARPSEQKQKRKEGKDLDLWLSVGGESSGTF